MTRSSIPVALAIALAAGGCAGVPHGTVTAVDRLRADMAWHSSLKHGQGCCDGVVGSPESYASGWREGYAAALSGSARVPEPPPPMDPAMMTGLDVRERANAVAWASGHSDGMAVAAASGAIQPAR